ncbi:MAG: sulfite exporter TauE/SafE family protein [Sandaracinaceae bacterium]|nr:sulfite exporter TauE/SafE family protein [Sandaracinaceae bacterium]
MVFLLFAAAFLAFGISAVTGGGASLVLVPLLSATLPVASVPAALSVGTGASSVARIATFRRDIRWDVACRFVPAALPMAALGALTLRYVNPAYVQVVMALFLIANLPLLLQRADSEPGEGAAQDVPAPVTARVVAIGATAGFLSGLTGAVGVLFNRFYLELGLTKDEIVATRATNEVLIHLVKLAMYAYLGLLTRDALETGALVAAAAALSAVALKPALRHVPRATFARIGYAAMVASGVALLVSSASRVVESDRISIDHRPILGGADLALHWRDSAIALELTYDEGLEVELPIDAAELTDAQHALVAREDPGSDAIEYEVVYGAEARHFEAYYLRAGQLLRKVTFDADGRLIDEGT